MAKNKQKMHSSDGPCSIMRACGGCEWLGLPYRKQLARKHAAMQELFEPLSKRFNWDIEVDPVLGMGSLDASTVETDSAANKPNNAEHGTIVHSPLVAPVTVADAPLAAPRAFRHKAASPFAPGKNGEVLGGFFARGTHQIVTCNACAVEAPELRGLLNEVAAAAEALGITSYDEDKRTGQLRYAVARKSWQTNELMLTLVTRMRETPHLLELAEQLCKAHPNLVCVAQNVNPRTTNAILGGETRILVGRASMQDKLLGCTFEVSPTSFYQVNPQQTEVLYQLAIDGLELKSGNVVLDTYCGSGTIGLCAVAHAKAQGINLKLVGVERNPAGVQDAKRNAALNNMEDIAEFITRDATEYMREAAAKREHVDALIMDPPRAGSTPEFIEAAASLAPTTVVYISCNPNTQARDLELFAHAGYQLVRFTPVDLFPHTTHVETVAVLKRD